FVPSSIALAMGSGKLIESDSLLDEAHALASASGVTDNQPLDADIDLHFTCFVKISDRCVLE
ncbi:hypothetical protein, partial [Providencia stuartii]|uniref:hypothetical protein n=1 Tax=Providencia stuartii TaxID=588 RepID=UPI001952A758